MPLPDFALGPLELEECAEDEPAIAPASARVRVGEDWYLLRGASVDYYTSCVFLRLDAPDAPIVVGHCYDMDGMDVDEKLKEMQRCPQEILQKLFWHRRVDSGRKSVLNLPLKLRLYTNEAEWEVKLDVDGNFSTAPWEFSCSAEWLLRASNQEVLSQVQEHLQDDMGDCAFALRWIDLADEEKSIESTSLKNGNWDDLATVLRCIAWECYADDLREDSEWEVSIEIADDAPESKWDECEVDDVFSMRTGDELDYAFSSEAARCLEILHSEYRPCYRQALLVYSAVKDVVDHGCFRRSFAVALPTQHERLEAHLRLREWLRGKVAPEEIPALLGEL